MITAPRLLLSGVRRQLENDSTPAVQEIVRYVLAERAAVRQLDRAMHALGETTIPSWFAALNGARCRVRLRSAGATGGVLACLRRPNEERAGEWLRRELGDVAWSDVRFDLRRAPSAIMSMPRGHLSRTARFARVLGEREDAFHVLRAVELLAYYAKLGELLDAGRHRVAVMSTYSNPWGIALNLAATARGIPIVHVMHGAALDPVPRLNYEAMILNDPASAEVFRRAGCMIGKTIVKSAGAGKVKVRAIPRADVAVGVLLSKEPDRRRVHELISALLRRADVASIAIRAHPAGLWSSMASEIERYPADKVFVSSLPLRDDLSRADVVIAGRSSAHIDALIAGVPSLYDPVIDSSAATGLSFLEDGTVFKPDDMTAVDLDAADAFYRRAGWQERFAHHANVAESPAEVRGRIRELFSRWIPEVAP